MVTLFDTTIEYRHKYTLPRLFETGLSFQMCREAAQWPGLEAMNAFLLNGIDDGQGGSTVRWSGCTIDAAEYRAAIVAVSGAVDFAIDTDDSTDWSTWFCELAVRLTEERG